MDPSNPSATHVVIKGSQRFHRSGAQVMGQSNPHESCEITVKVRRKAELPEPDPDKPISKADLTSLYGADTKDLDTVVKVLTAFGLTLKSKSEGRHCVEFVGPVSAMEQAFGVKLSRVKHESTTYRGRVGSIHIPAALDGIVTGVFGLDTRPMIKRRGPTRVKATSTLPPADSRTWYIPQELADAYQFPAGDGDGQTVAILEFGGQFLPDDLNSFLQLVNLPSASPNVLVRNIQTLNASDQNDPDAIGEVMLDIEIVAAICPKATIVVLFSNFSDNGWIANLDAILSDPASPSVVSVSYGLAEGTDIWMQTSIDHINDALKVLANAGITVCISSGDDGTDDQVPDGLAHLDFPAGSPYVLAVGGTALNRSTGDEVVWFDPDGLRRDGGGSTGGGVSAFNPRPSWQQDFDIISVNPNAPKGRIIPDVAANAAGSTGYLLFAPDQNNPSNPVPQISGGTSTSTPLWASLILRLQQAGKKVGFLPPRLYRPSPNSGGKPVGAVAFRDITQGSNASGTAEGYSAKPGFDAVSGWGSPIGKGLFTTLP
jgi:kumamolisin